MFRRRPLWSDLNKFQTKIKIKNKLAVFNCFVIIIFFSLFDENGIFCIQSGQKRRKMAAEICSARADLYINLSNVFAECVHFLISRIREYCREYFQLQFKPIKFLCLRSMLAAKMFVIQTRNYILKCANSSVLFSEMACDKNQTYLQVRCVQSRTHRTCKYVWFLSHAISLKSTEEFAHFSI
jgi:hypothetical protein